MHDASFYTRIKNFWSLLSYTRDERLRGTSAHVLARHYLLLLMSSHGGSHSVRVHLALIVAVHELVHADATNSLLLADRTVLVSKEKGLEVDNFIS